MRRDRYIEPGSQLTHQRRLGAFRHDPYWSFVTFYANWWGANGATAAVEQRNHALTFNSGAVLDTSQFIWGPSSLRVALTDDTVTTPASADWQFGAWQDFTIELFVRFNSVTASSGNQTFISYYNNVGNQRSWYLRLTSSTLQFFASDDGTSTLFTVDGAWSPSNGVWYHIGVERYNANVRTWVDATTIATLNNLSTDNALFASSQALMIGALNSSGVVQEFDGWVGFTRITKAARYKGIYVVPPIPPPIG